MSAIAGGIGTGPLAAIGAGYGVAYAVVREFTAAGAVVAGASASGSEPERPARSMTDHSERLRFNRGLSFTGSRGAGLCFQLKEPPHAARYGSPVRCPLSNEALAAIDVRLIDRIASWRRSGRRGQPPPPRLPAVAKLGFGYSAGPLPAKSSQLPRQLCCKPVIIAMISFLSVALVARTPICRPRRRTQMRSESLKT